MEQCPFSCLTEFGRGKYRSDRISSYCSKSFSRSNPWVASPMHLVLGSGSRSVSGENNKYTSLAFDPGRKLLASISRRPRQFDSGLGCALSTTRSFRLVAPSSPPPPAYSYLRVISVDGTGRLHRLRTWAASGRGQLRAYSTIIESTPSSFAISL